MCGLHHADKGWTPPSARASNLKAWVGTTNLCDMVSIRMYPGVFARRMSSSTPENAICTLDSAFVSSWLDRCPTKKFSVCARSSLLIVDGDCVEYTIPI